jgi:hypothetical protein
MEDRMKRREFLALICAAAAGWPRLSRAEKNTLQVIGYLGFDTAEKSTELLVAFRGGLRAQAATAPNFFGNDLGLQLTSLNDQARKRYHVRKDVHGVVITKVDHDSEAAEMQVDAGDVIVTASEVAVPPASTFLERRVVRGRSTPRRKACVPFSGDDGPRDTGPALGSEPLSFTMASRHF